MVKKAFLVALSLWLVSSFYVEAQPFTHIEWTDLLSKYVSSNGKVDYKGFKADQEKLQVYLDQLSTNPPTPGWPKNEKLSFWINAYNAFTIKLIIDNYPLKSIQDLNPVVPIPGLSTVWDKKFFKIGGIEMSLNEIEHEILRKEFDEPRIHFAIVCASFSCPNLRNEAFVATKIEQQLQDQAFQFINDPTKNTITKDGIELSMIFQWFTSDFTKHGDLIEFINHFSKIPISARTRVKFREYDWRLNE